MKTAWIVRGKFQEWVINIAERIFVIKVEDTKTDVTNIADEIKSLVPITNISKKKNGGSKYTKIHCWYERVRVLPIVPGTEIK